MDFVWFLLVGILPCFVILLITILVNIWRGDKYDDPIISVFILSSIAAGILQIVWVVTGFVVYPSSLSTVAKLEAFSNNIGAYTRAIDDSREMILTGRFSIDALTDVAYANLAAESSQRIAEKRDAIVRYNENLAELKKFNNIPLLGLLVADVPDHLEYILTE